jgi:hypothetical protein
MNIVRVVIALIVLTTGLTQMAFADARPADRHGVVASNSDKTVSTQPLGQQPVQGVILSPANPETIKIRIHAQMPTRKPS